MAAAEDSAAPASSYKAKGTWEVPKRVSQIKSSSAPDTFVTHSKETVGKSDEQVQMLLLKQAILDYTASLRLMTTIELKISVAKQNIC